MKDQIENCENAPLNYGGIEVSNEEAELLYDAVELALKRIKKKNKEKYTPKKYKDWFCQSLTKQLYLYWGNTCNLVKKYKKCDYL